MNTFRRLRRSLAGFCIFLLLAPMVLPVHAAMVGNDEVVSEARGSADRAEVMAFLDRDDVRAQLEAQGVDPADAKARVAAMTDAEVAELQARMDEIPAGAGPSVLGVALVVFIVFVVTDVIGATDIFPFIRPVE